MTPAETVTEFLHRVDQLNLDGAAELLAEDVLYDNVPMEPKFNGRDTVIAVLKGWLGAATEADWQVLRQTETGQMVMNERLDRVLMAGKWVEIPCAGIFEVGDDGLIHLWRDYFDLATFTSQL